MGTDRQNIDAEIHRLCEAADWSGAASAALRHYGPEVLGFLHAALRDREDAREAFSLFSEALWRGLPRLRWQSSFRTWAYALARSALGLVWRERCRRGRLVEWAEVSERLHEAHAEPRRTPAHLRTEVKVRVRGLRAELDPEEQAILTLRIDRGMSWRDIALVMAGEDAPATDVARQSALLRKRFERLKGRIREMVELEHHA